MNRADIEMTLKQIALDELGTTAEALADRLACVDSLERMQLAVAVEDRFAIRLDAADEVDLDSLAALTVLVERKLAAPRHCEEPVGLPAAAGCKPSE